jgi:chromosome segregation ATPase
MRHQFIRPLTLALVLLLSISLCFDEALAQRKRNKRSRRITNPIVVTPVSTPTTSATEPQIISTADQQASDQASTSETSGQVPNNSRRTNRKSATPEPESDADSMRRTVNDLTNQVTKLSDKLSQMESQQRTLVDLERLSRAEQRAEALRTQLRDVQEKESNLQGRKEQIDFDLKPENIERSVAAYGSTHPEEARDARRRALENEKSRTQAQLDLMTTSRQRLETAITSADLEVEKLRKRIDDANEGQPPTNTNPTENSNDTEDVPANTTPTTNTPPPSSTPPQP